MSGRDFDPFGSLGPINPQDPSGPEDLDLPPNFGAGKDPVTRGSEGDLAPWKPEARPARSPFTPVPEPSEPAQKRKKRVRRASRPAPTPPVAGEAAGVGAAAGVAAAAVEAPVDTPVETQVEAGASPMSETAVDLATETVVMPSVEPAADQVVEPVIEPVVEPELMFFPAAEPVSFDAALAASGPAEDEPAAAIHGDADAEGADSDGADSDGAELEADDDAQFADAEQFLMSLTEELDIDVEELDDPRWASDPAVTAEGEASSAPDATAPIEPEPVPVPVPEPAPEPEPELAPAPAPEPVPTVVSTPVSAFEPASAFGPFVPLVPVIVAPDAAADEFVAEVEPGAAELAADPVAAAEDADFAAAAGVATAGTVTATAGAAAATAATTATATAATAGGLRRWLPYAAAVVIPLLFGGAIWATAGGPQTATPVADPKPAAEAPAPAPVEEGPIRIVAMGDMLPHDSVNQNAVQADGSISFAPFFEGIQPNLAGADAVFCNQEVPSAGADFGISGYPTFNTYAEFARDLNQSAGCNLVNLATNHTADKGVEGIAATRAQWDGLETLSVSGANRSVEEQHTIQYGEVRGVKTALVSFAEYSNASVDGVSLNFMADEVLVQQLMTEARANAQLVIVSAHWGTEDSHDVNDQQRAFAQRVADLGADVVLGTGPHMLQPVEWVPRADGGQTLVWYSLGNMLNTQLGLDQRVGLIASFDVVPGADGGPATVANPAGVLTWMHYDWTPEEEAAQQLDARHSLSLQPLAASAELLARTTYGVSVEQIAEQSAAILGPVVQLNPGV